MPPALRPLPPLLLLGAIWGATPAFVKHLGAAGWPPMLIASCAAAGSALMPAAICRLRGLAVPLSPAHLRHYAVSGMFGVALALATGRLAAGAMQAALLAAATGQASLPPAAGLPVSVLQAVCMAGAFLLYFRSLAAHGGVITSQTGYVVTLTGIAWGWMLFGERPGWLTIPAAALVFSGLALVTLPARRVSRSGA